MEEESESLPDYEEDSIIDEEEDDEDKNKESKDERDESISVGFDKSSIKNYF